MPDLLTLAQRVRQTYRSYLGNGGFFNPELMEHQKVADLLAEFDQLAEAVQQALGSAPPLERFSGLDIAANIQEWKRPSFDKTDFVKWADVEARLLAQQDEITRLRAMHYVDNAVEIERQRAEQAEARLLAAQQEMERLAKENLGLAVRRQFVEGIEVPETVKRARLQLIQRLEHAEADCAALQAENERLRTSFAETGDGQASGRIMAAPNVADAEETFHAQGSDSADDVAGISGAGTHQTGSDDEAVYASGENGVSEKDLARFSLLALPRVQELESQVGGQQVALARLQEVLRALVEKLDIALPKLNDFVVCASVRAGRDLYDGPNVTAELKAAKDLLAAATPVDQAQP